ncbi:MAG TPA: hypothetical protein VJT84_07725 [Gaiellaceae bacterium]|nr:hypothetical protein [Gaiellaceae bacterium]
MVAITRRKAAALRNRATGMDIVNYISGKCTTKRDGGCAPPFEVQIWPSCVRNPSTYRLTPAGRPLPSKRTSLRGVPAAYFEDGHRLELYTGRVTIVMFGRNRKQLAQAAASLEGVNNQGPAGRPLPAPAEGALKGQASC